MIAKTFPPEQVRQVLAATGKASERERDLPAPVMVDYAIALALNMGSSIREALCCLLEGLRWRWGAEAVKMAGKPLWVRAGAGDQRAEQRRRRRHQKEIASAHSGFPPGRAGGGTERAERVARPSAHAQNTSTPGSAPRSGRPISRR